MILRSSGWQTFEGEPAYQRRRLFVFLCKMCGAVCVVGKYIYLFM